MSFKLPNPLTPRSGGVVLAAAAIGLSSLLTTGAAASQPPKTKPTIVLVHGAWADASSWNRVAKRLQRAGYPVVAPANPLRGMTSDSLYMASVLAGIPGPIVLVAHSYGGAVITNAATGNKNVKALVFVAGFIPDENETAADLFKFDGSLIVLPPSPDATVTPRPFPGGLDFYVNVDQFHNIFAADLPGEKAALLAATQRPLALAAFTDKSGPAAWKSIPTWALIANQDNTIGTKNTLAMAQRATSPSHIVRIDASHAVLLSQPEAVVDIINKAVRGVQSTP